MTDFDFIECEFINDYMKFVTFKGFCDNAYVIKINFKSLNRNGKQFYKWYIYANIHMREFEKNKIWDYLNGDISIAELKSIYLERQK